MTAKEYLESKGLNDHDYMDSGMINHISEMMEEYHQAKLHLLTISNVVNCKHENYTPYYGREGELMEKRCDECGQDIEDRKSVE